MQPKGLTKDVEWNMFKLSLSTLCSKKVNLPLRLEVFVLYPRVSI